VTVTEGEERGTGAGGDDPREEEPSVRLPDWRDPPTGEIPRIIEELAGEPLPNWRVEDTGRFDIILDGVAPEQSEEAVGERTVEIRPEGTPRPTDEPLEETWHLEPDTLGRGSPLRGEDTLVDSPSMPRHRRRPAADEVVVAQGESEPRGLGGNAQQVDGEAPPSDQSRGPEVLGEDLDWPDATLLSRDTHERDASSRPSGQGGQPRHEQPATGRAATARGDERLSRHDVVASRRRRRVELGPEPEEASPVPSAGRSKLVSTLTGIVLGALVLAALARGPVTTLVVVTLALAVAAIEAYELLRRAGYVPMIALGVVSVVVMSVYGYLRGEGAVLGVLAGSTVVTLVWFALMRGGRYLLRGFGPTQALVMWVGLFGSFASLMLRPADFGPQGLGLFVGTLATAVAADVFAFFGGSLLGRRPLAPRISPGKTVEGVVIGGLAAVLVGAFGVARIHPFDLASGLALGVLAALIVPLGDLAESALKRLVDAKDSSRLLPGHGGMLDRIDGILLLLPCAYALFSLMHLA